MGCPGTWETFGPLPGRARERPRAHRCPGRPTRNGRDRGVPLPEETEGCGKGAEESERLVVPEKPGNRPEGLGGGKGAPGTEPRKGKRTSTPMQESVSTKQAWIAERAKQMPGVALLTLANFMDLDWLREAHRRTRKDGAVGVDGQTADEYEEHLEENLQSLLDRVKSGTYRAPPVRRVHIPKGDGQTRPIGIPTYEDKILQRAVVMLLEPVYEQEFYDFSYGFRPRRAAHDALSDLDKGLFQMHGGWILDVDIKSFFDSLDRATLRGLLHERVVDGVVTRLVGKWLRAGVLEGGVMNHVEKGTPQGGVISPLLANIYLHEVLDTWWSRDVLPRMRGRAFLIRYADDFVMVFSEKEDAEKIFAVLPKRFGRFGLTLHSEKTRMVRFLPPGPNGEPAESFDFLGFTHYLGQTKRGYWTPRRKTSRKRMSRTLTQLGEWMGAARHVPIKRQAVTLGQKLLGHFAYYGIQGNSKAIGRFAYEARRLWWKWLSRRSQRGRLTWDAFNKLLERHPLPPARLRADVWQQRLANL